MPEYPRTLRNFDFSLPDARARWISEAYGIPLDHVMSGLLMQDLQMDGSGIYITNEMFLASVAFYAKHFPERMAKGLEPVRWSWHPDNPDHDKVHVVHTPETEYWDYLRTTMDRYTLGGKMTFKQFMAAQRAA